MFLDIYDPFRVIDSVFNQAPNYIADDVGEAFRLNFDLPGVKKEDLKIEVSGSKLMISAQRKKGRQAEFKKIFDLPSTIDSEKVQATLEDGILSVELPKTQQEKPRLIQIA